MNPQQIEKFVMRYLETLECHIIEKGLAHVTVKLSPAADKDLTQRSYYWSFVERTGVTPETMTYCFIFDPVKMNAESQAKLEGSVPSQQQGLPRVSGQPLGGLPSNLPNRSALPMGNLPNSSPTLSAQPPGSTPSGAATPPESILGRYFGVNPRIPTPGRVPRDEVTYGSRRLEQIFAVVRNKGKFIRVFEEPNIQQRSSVRTVGYSTWLGINYKVELTCDMKREEIHSLGIDLATGKIVNDFHHLLLAKKLTSRLPPKVFLLPAKIALLQASCILETEVEHKVKAYDHRWAEEASLRLQDELVRIDSYYGEILASVEADKKQEVEERYRNRQQEIDWQYRPKIRASVINCGLFHLHGENGL